MGVGIAEDETNGRKEVAFTGTIATNDDIMLRGEGLNHGLILVAIMQILLARAA